MLNLRYNSNGNSAEDLLGQLNAIRKAAQALHAALYGDLTHGRNYQIAPANIIDPQRGDRAKVHRWQGVCMEIETEVEATMVEMLKDARVAKAWAEMERAP